ncbi:MAG TPA: hypothetical protein VIO33_15035 [Burkholderiaceae bacterium]
MMRRRIARLHRSVWGWPAVLALLSSIGLLSALIGDGVWDWVSWVGLGVPASLCVVLGLPVRRKPTARSAVADQRAVAASRGARSL